MIKWNYRVIQTPDGASETGSCFAVHEVYYDDNGNPTSWTSEPIMLACESVRDLIRDAAWIFGGLVKPVLYIDGNGKLAEVVEDK